MSSLRSKPQSCRTFTGVSYRGGQRHISSKDPNELDIYRYHQNAFLDVCKKHSNGSLGSAYAPVLHITQIVVLTRILIYDTHTHTHTTPFLRVYIEGLAVGNITKSEVVGMATKLRAMLSSQLGTRPIFPSQVSHQSINIFFMKNAHKTKSLT